jgi:hypothetical protein
MDYDRDYYDIIRLGYLETDVQNESIAEDVYLAIYTGCNRRNGPDFGRVFLMLNYIEKPQNTYIQS